MLNDQKNNKLQLLIVVHLTDCRLFSDTSANKTMMGGSNCIWSGCLNHWGRVRHICVGNLTIIGSDNGLSPGRRQAIIWTNAGILLIQTLGTNFSEILGEIHPFSFSKMHLKMSSAKWRLFGLGLNELIGPGNGQLSLKSMMTCPWNPCPLKVLCWYYMAIQSF